MYRRGDAAVLNFQGRRASARVMAHEHARVDEEHVPLEPGRDAPGRRHGVPHHDAIDTLALENRPDLPGALLCGPQRVATEPERTILAHHGPFVNRLQAAHHLKVCGVEHADPRRQIQL